MTDNTDPSTTPAPADQPAPDAASVEAEAEAAPVKVNGPFPVSQEIFTKHAQRLWSMEAHIANLPEGPEKESLKADFHEWHKELAEDYASLADAEGNQPQPLSGGTNKDNAPA